MPGKPSSLSLALAFAVLALVVSFLALALVVLALIDTARASVGTT